MKYLMFLLFLTMVGCNDDPNTLASLKVGDCVMDKVVYKVINVGINGSYEAIDTNNTRFIIKNVHNREVVSCFDFFDNKKGK